MTECHEHSFDCTRHEHCNGETHRIELKNVTVKIGGVTIVYDVTADMHCGDITAVIGPNGAGKSTLLKAIMGLLPYTGEINFCLENLCGGGRPQIGYVPQRLDFDRGNPVSVLDFLSLKNQTRPMWFGHAKKVREKAEEALKWAGAAHLIDKRLGGLSGGEIQRVMLAFALIDMPDIILLDEPASGIDAAGEEIFADLLRKLQQLKSFTVVLVSHDLSTVTQLADRVICINKTVRHVGRTIEVLTPENLGKLFGQTAGLHYHPKELGRDPNA